MWGAMRAGILLFILIALWGCSNKSNPVYPDGYIDPDILGYWYRITSSKSQGRPDQNISGFELSEDGFWYSLGANHNTGKLGQYPNQLNPTVIIRAAEGTLIRQSPDLHALSPYLDTLSYERNDSTLTLIYFNNSGGDPFRVDYKQGNMESVVLTPTSSSVSVLQDGKAFTNATIWSYPSAYFGMGYSHELDSLVHEIVAYDDGQNSIHIQLKDFNGPGTYLLGDQEAGKAYYFIDGGCVIMIFSMEDRGTGFVTISDYDTSTKMCSGNFAFTLRGEPLGPDSLITFSDGEFTIPVFN